MITAALCGSMMVIIILVLRAAFLHRLPKWLFRALWILAALRLLLPFSFTFEVEVDMPTYAYDTVVLNRDEVAVIDTESGEEYASVNAGSFIKAVYLLGAFSSGGFMFYAYIRMRRSALSGDILPDGASKCGDLIAVRCAESCKVPFSCGVFPPVICIPREVLSLDPYELELILVHEKQHIRSGDQLVKWLITAAFCLNWYNPAAWVMLSVANRDIELACDEAVVRRVGDSKKYALTLIASAESCAVTTVCSFGAPVLDERIRCIMRSKKTTVLGFVAAGVMLTLMTAFFVSISAVDARNDNSGDASVDGFSAAEHADEKVPEETASYFWSYSDAAVTDDQLPDDVRVIYSVENEVELDDGMRLACPLEQYSGISGAYGEHTNPIGVVYFNNGVNVVAEKGTEVYAAADGTVLYAGYDHENGNMITVSHGDDCVTYYRHLEVYDCKEGDEVAAGEYIASVGATGRVTGANLGFSVMVDGGYIDPTPLFE